MKTIKHLIISVICLLPLKSCGQPTLANSDDIIAAKARANHTGVQAISTVTGLQTALDGKINTSASTATGLTILGMSAPGNDVLMAWNGSGVLTPISKSVFVTDSLVVHNTGVESIGGTKTFTNNQKIYSVNTSGTLLEIKTSGSFTGNFLDLINSSSISKFQIDQSGNINSLGYISTSSDITSSGGSVYTNNLIASGSISFFPNSSATPSSNGQLIFEATSDTTVTVKLKGSDGVVRKIILALLP